MKTVETTCGTCHQPFQAPQKEVKRGRGKYCSRRCNSMRPRPRPRVKCACAWCGDPFTRTVSKCANSRSGLQFCSRTCKDTAQSLAGGFVDIQPPHYGTGPHDHRKLAFEFYPPRCARCDYDRFIAILQVHHRDRNRFNGTRENLEILCPTCHMTEHFLAGDGLFWGVSDNSSTTGLHPVGSGA